MELKKLLTDRMGQLEIEWIVDALLAKRIDFLKFYTLIDDSDQRVAWRALWVCDHLMKRRECHMLDAHVSELTDRLLACEHEGMRRMYLNILLRLPMEKPMRVDLLDACLEWMQSESEPPAVQAVSMKMAYRMVCDKPDFLKEFCCLLEMMQPQYFTPAINSTVCSIQRKLTKR